MLIRSGKCWGDDQLVCILFYSLASTCTTLGFNVKIDNEESLQDKSEDKLEWDESESESELNLT